MIDFSRNHFELLGLPPRFRIDGEALDRAYRDLQRAVHPDRYTGAPDTQKRLALQASARANEAYRTLRDPVDRAEYLLSLRGVDATAQTDSRLAVAFLTRQLERREQAEQAAESNDAQTLRALIDDVRGDARELTGEVEQALEANDDVRARLKVRELRFLTKLAEDFDLLAAAESDDR